VKAWLVALALCGAQDPAPAPAVPQEPLAQPVPAPQESPPAPPAPAAEAQAGPERVVVAADDVVIDRDCMVEIAAAPIADANGDGVIRITGEGVTVDFALAHLRGAPPGSLPDAYSGLGVVVEAPGVTLRNARVSGFKVGILARKADRLVIEDSDVSGNFRQRLLSTPQAEEGSDWLWPHANDSQEWRSNYGAGICIEDSQAVTVRRCRARAGQNGLILDRVNGARIYDNDFSFLSGWGVALWRASDNVISRNALDFCVRGYSHGVYNRGQDSAGILMFEQCSRNVIAENSITHGGDGIFGFAGREALGELPGPEGFEHTGKGCNENLFVGNDLSYAPAHGLEMTFSFGNVVLENRFVENAICGVWGGYSQRSLILRNEFVANGQAGYGLERGGINIEHSKRNAFIANRFEGNACGVHLWWDADESLMQTPWARVNGGECAQNLIAANSFTRDAVGLHLRDCGETQAVDNSFAEVGSEIEGPAPTQQGLLADFFSGLDPYGQGLASRRSEALGENRPVGARAHLRGRERILMTEWGPYDWQGPYLQRVASRGAREVWRWLGDEVLDDVTVEGSVELAREPGPPPQVLVTSSEEGALVPYTIVARSASGEIRRPALLSTVRWAVRVFPWSVDPREDEAGWRAQAEGALAFELADLDLAYGGAGASQLAGLPESVAAAQLPSDRFGTLAEARVRLPQGRWKLTVTSDDGVRVKLDGESVLEDWTWHAPRTGSAVIEGDRVVLLEVEHFELDGFAVLRLAIEPAE